jgi:hypothetical protein
MSIANKQDMNTYYRPCADGRIVKKISEQEYNDRVKLPNDNVRKRDWVAGNESGTAFEEYYANVRGRIISISFREHESYGRSINILLRNDSGDEGIFSCQTSSSYGMSLMEALADGKLDLDKPVTISAYSKEKDGKVRKTIYVSQGEGKGENLVSPFRKWNEDTKTFDLFMDYPAVNEKEQKKFGKDYWSKRYFPEVEVFLVDYVTEHIIPTIEDLETTEVVPDEGEF